MIAVHLEPKGLDRDTPALDDNYRPVSRAKAMIGSDLLRDAILRAKGHPVPEKPKKPGKSPVKLRHLPKCCNACGSPLRPISGLVSHIQATVCGYYGIALSGMQSAQRGFDISHPRQIAMFLASELTPQSLPEIGRRFGGRDHTTVIWAIKQVKARILEDPEIAEDVKILRRVLAA